MAQMSTLSSAKLFANPCELNGKIEWWISMEFQVVGGAVCSCRGDWTCESAAAGGWWWWRWRGFIPPEMRHCAGGGGLQTSGRRQCCSVWVQSPLCQLSPSLAHLLWGLLQRHKVFQCVVNAVQCFEIRYNLSLYLLWQLFTDFKLPHLKQAKMVWMGHLGCLTAGCKNQ